jgi:hypothetical protein
MEREFGSGNRPIDYISTQWGSFVRVDKLATELKRSEIVQALTSSGATLQGAVKVAGYTDEEQEYLVRGDWVEDYEMPYQQSPDTTGLNGAQITAALDLMAAVAARQTSRLVGLELLISIGIDRARAEAMINSALTDGVTAASTEGREVIGQ